MKHVIPVADNHFFGQFLVGLVPAGFAGVCIEKMWKSKEKHG
jgi:hypothetical protein